MDDASRVDALLEIVGNLYAAALEPERNLDALQAINRSLRGSAAQVIRLNRATGEVIDSQTDQTISQRLNDDYVRHWSAIDPRPRLLAGLASGETTCCHEVFDVDYVSRDPYYQEFFIPSGFRWAVGGIVHGQDGISTIVANLRAPDLPHYSREDSIFIRRLLPHVAQAAWLRDSVATRLKTASSVNAVIACLPSPCLVVDHSCIVHSVSRSAERVLASLGSHIVHGRLRFDAQGTDARWTSLLNNVIQSAVGAGFEARARDGSTWKLDILPWRSLGCSSDATEPLLNVVTFQQTSAPAHIGLGELGARYSLTTAELDVLFLLRKGLRPKEIARERSTSPHTVRDQIAALLTKTGCRSQVELLALAAGTTAARHGAQGGAS